MGSLKLYELPSKYRLVMEEIDATDGELSPDIEKDLACITGTLEEKTDAILQKRTELISEVEVIRKEVQRLEKLAKSRKSKADWLTQYLKNTLEAMGIRRVTTPRFNISVCHNARPSVTFTGDIDHLPSEWTVMTIHANTQRAYEAWDAGEPVHEDFQIVQGTHLRIT